MKCLHYHVKILHNVYFLLFIAHLTKIKHLRNAYNFPNFTLFIHPSDQFQRNVKEKEGEALLTM
uniref:Uncharacterized protein n=1 Tax=Siphoviridae sp. ct87j35 TaxID=2825356 RepID=A0A8S5V4F6_9CAUD|nr:MAG TPA: hypothetical protein [Siphoviridae sp. ct87j35]